MKSLTFAFAFLATSTSAFAPITNNAMRTNSHRFLSELTPEEITEAEVTVTDSVAAATNILTTQSTSLPFLPRPQYLDGSLPGDVGFDPFNFAKSPESLLNFREAEVKHARLAMLAAAGWPLSEVFDKKIAAVLGMAPILGDDDRVPSVLNGGLGKISPAYWVGCIGVAALIDIMGTLRSKSDNYAPGDYGLRLGYPTKPEDQMWMQTAEIKNGRLAMIAVFGFAIQEFVSKVGVVDETPLFFYPIAEVMRNYANSGYIQ